MTLQRLTFILSPLCALGLAAVGCTEAPQAPAQQSVSSTCLPGTVGCQPTGTAGTPATSTAPKAGTNGVVTAPPGSAGTTSVPPNSLMPKGGATASDPAGAGVPCEIANAVSAHCTICHAAVPRAGAPMPLMTLADFKAASKMMPSMPVYKVIPPRINATDPRMRMPPASSTALTAPELQAFNTWLDGGAVGVTGSAACAIKETSFETDAGPATMGGMGHASITPIEYNDPDMKCYKLLTHAQGDLNKPYTHGPGEQYMNFTFKAPWSGTMYSRAIKVATDPNSRVIHHWLLFRDTSNNPESIQAGSGIHPDSALLHGWAPGASPIYLDPDLGMKMPSNVSYTVEAHFNNSTGAPGDDHSGPEICVTPKVPKNVVDISWVGSDSIVGSSATGTCTPHGSDPIHLIAAQPHMHLKGQHMKVVVNRKGGMKQTIHDEDFSFDDQRYYILDTVLMPGDTMTTTCSYSGPATFGSSTNNEMCYFFTLHWPGGAIGTQSPLHGANTCLN